MITTIHSLVSLATLDNLCNSSFIPDIYIAPLQETYSEALSVSQCITVLMNKLVNALNFHLYIEFLRLSLLA